MTYILLDSGNAKKLEQVGAHRLIRPCPQAVWNPGLPPREWAQAEDTYQRPEKGQGGWQNNCLPESWEIEFGGFTLQIKPTAFGHLGLFAEQVENWHWLTSVSKPEMRTLNLFAYTGGATLAMRRGGAVVTHLDAAKSVVEWAKVNAAKNQYEDIRWLVDDARKFLQREIKRGKSYAGIVLDPPSFGRGKRGERWQIAAHFLPLLTASHEILKPPGFLLVSCHSPEYTTCKLESMITSLWGRNIQTESFRMTIPAAAPGREVPAGICTRVIFGK